MCIRERSKLPHDHFSMTQNTKLACCAAHCLQFSTALSNTRVHCPALCLLVRDCILYPRICNELLALETISMTARELAGAARTRSRSRESGLLNIPLWRGFIVAAIFLFAALLVAGPKVSFGARTGNFGGREPSTPRNTRPDTADGSLDTGRLAQLPWIQQDLARFSPAVNCHLGGGPTD